MDGARLRMLTEQACWMYEWVILDLPTIFTRTSLMAVSECERAYVVSTPELPLVEAHVESAFLRAGPTVLAAPSSARTMNVRSPGHPDAQAR